MALATTLMQEMQQQKETIRTQSIRLLLCHSCPLFRCGVRAVLEHTPDIEIAVELADAQSILSGAPSLPGGRGLKRAVIARTSNIEIIAEPEESDTLLHLADDHQPDVVLLDSGIPNNDVVQLVAQLRLVGARGICVLTDHPSETELFRLLLAGAAAYELSTLTADELLLMIRRAAAGEYLISSAVLSAKMRRSRSQQQLVVPPSNVSAQELEILSLFARGRSTHEVVRELALNPQALKKRLTRLFKRLSVSSRQAAVALALRKRWISYE